MKQRNWPSFLIILLIVLTFLGFMIGCDSGEQVVDEMTGNRAVKQYHKSKEDLSKIVGQQDERHKGIPDDEKEGDEQQH